VLTYCLRWKLLSIKGCQCATELKLCETSFARIEEGRRRGGEWNENRNLAPGFIREEENKGKLLLPTSWVTGKTVRGGRLRFQVKSTQGRIGGWGGEWSKREARRAFEIQHIFYSFFVWFCKFLPQDKRSNFDNKFQSFLFVSWLRVSKVPIHPQPGV